LVAVKRGGKSARNALRSHGCNRSAVGALTDTSTARQRASDRARASSAPAPRAQSVQKRKGPGMPGPSGAYFRAVETLVKVVFSFEPTVCTATMIATEMPAAINPYSIAVAPDSSLRKRRTKFDI